MKPEKPLKVIVALSTLTEFVKFTQCDYQAAALCRCAHVTVLLMLRDYVAEHGYIVQAACTPTPCQWNKGKKRKKIHKKHIKLNITVPVKGKDLMNFINGTQDHKNLEVMLMLVLLQYL